VKLPSPRKPPNSPVPEPGITNHWPLTVFPSSVPASWSRNDPFRPAMLPVMRSMPTKLGARFAAHARLEDQLLPENR
jgi:hypothetical protein